MNNLSEEEKNAMNENEIKFRAYLLILNSEFPTHRKTEAMEELLKIYNNQQKEIEEEHKNWKELLHEYGIKCQELEVLREENFDTIYMKAVADFKDKIREKIKILKNELRKNNENIDYTRKLAYTADETIKKEIQDLEKLLEE